VAARLAADWVWVLSPRFDGFDAACDAVQAETAPLLVEGFRHGLRALVLAAIGGGVAPEARP
jgi:hypothetical protein